MKRTIIRKKNKQYPKIPRTIEQFKEEFAKPQIMKEYGRTLHGDSNFYLGTEITEDYKFAVFYSEFVVNFIKEKIAINSRRYVMDATFDSLPDGYYQLLIIAVEFQNHVSYRPPVRPPARPLCFIFVS